MPIISARLLYRKPTPDDIASIFAIYGDPRTNLFNPSGPIASEAAAAALLSRWLEHWQAHGYGWWAIAEKNVPENVIGFGGIAFYDYMGQQRVNLGYRFAVSAWGQGFATEMGETALAHAFTTLKLPEVYGLVRPAHVASIRVLEKIGMQGCGELPDVPGQAPSLMFRAAKGRGRWATPDTSSF